MEDHDNSDPPARAGHFDAQNAFQRWLKGDDAALNARRLSEPYGGGDDDDPGPSPAPYLESKPNYCPEGKLDQSKANQAEPFDRFYEVHPCRCKSRFCPHCCVGLGIKLKKKLAPILTTFTHLQMWTFTIDPELFTSPEQAFDYVKQRRAISRVINRLQELGHLHTKRYFYVVEWQKNGMPHFHVLLDTSRIPFEVVCDLWNAYRPDWAGPVQGERPAFGSVRFSASRDFTSPEHAANYACKYLIKHPADGYPDWVLDSERRIRRYETSRGFWGNEKPKVEEVDLWEREEATSNAQLAHLPECFCEVCRGDELPMPPEKKPTTIRQRISKCKEDAVLLLVSQHILPDGEIVEEKQFVRNLSVPFSDVLTYLGWELDMPELPQLLTFTEESVSILDRVSPSPRSPRPFNGVKK